jgi:MoxR-like ATPase
MNSTEFAQIVKDNVGHVIIGKSNVTELLLVALLTEGHVLLEDVPGIGKTTLAKALAKSLDCSFARIQFTPDLLPSDVTGLNYYNQKSQAFEFRPGPVLSQILLADEINRATPRTQSALLEAMAEGRVTVDGVTHPLEPPFLVIATQNPIDHEGTFPLPEAQLDRFLMRFSLGYPSMDEELKMLEMLKRGHPLDTLQPVVSSDELRAAQQAVREVHVDEKVRQYLTEIVHGTRQCDDLALGGSPRASIALFRTAQALAAASGRNFVQPDDVKRVAAPVLTHRLILRPESRLRKMTAAKIVGEIVEEVPVPVLSQQGPEWQ